MVPYSPYLSEMFHCHINVEVFSSVRGVKYITMYIHTGYDKTTMILSGLNDKIKQYIDSSYIGPEEVVWRLLENSMHEEVPNVVRLALDEPGMHLVNYKLKDTPNDIMERAKK